MRIATPVTRSLVRNDSFGMSARDGGSMRVSGPTGTSRIVGADQRPARGSFPQRGDCGLALPVAEEARAQFPQRSKKRRNSEARTVFRAPQGGQVASADLTRGRRRMRESDGQAPSLSLAHRPAFCIMGQGPRSADHWSANLSRDGATPSNARRCGRRQCASTGTAKPFFQSSPKGIP